MYLYMTVVFEVELDFGGFWEMEGRFENFWVFVKKQTKNF